MHNGTKYTPDALEQVIKGLQDKGYEIVPVSKLLYTGEYAVDNTGRQIEKQILTVYDCVMLSDVTFFTKKRLTKRDDGLKVVEVICIIVC